MRGIYLANTCGRNESRATRRIRRVQSAPPLHALREIRGFHVEGEPAVRAIWQQAGIECVMVRTAPGYDVQLRDSEGVAFLRKSAPTTEAACNDAEYLRLLFGSDTLPAPAASLKPFALVVEDDEDNCEAFAEAL